MLWNKIKLGAICLVAGIILGAAGVLIIAKGNSDQRFTTIGDILDDSGELDRRFGDYHSRLKQTNSDVAGIVDRLSQQIASDNLRHREQIEHILLSFGSVGEGLSTAKDIIRQVKERIRSVRIFLQSGRDSP